MTELEQSTNKSQQTNDTLHHVIQRDASNLKENVINIKSAPDFQRASREQLQTPEAGLDIKPGRVLSNRVLPHQFNPVPLSAEAEAVYVVNVDSKLGFTAQRIMSNQQEVSARLQQIQQIWNQQVINDIWQSAVSSRYLEEEIVEVIGFIVVVRKKLVTDANNKSKEIWDTTIWNQRNGSIRATHQFLSENEPIPALYQNAEGEEQMVYMLSPDQFIIPDPDTGTFELKELKNSEGRISGSIYNHKLAA